MPSSPISGDASDEPSSDVIPDDDVPPDDADASVADGSAHRDAGEILVDGGGSEDSGGEVPDEHQYVFVTSASYRPAGFGGLTGADAKCAELAAAANRTGTWKAWLSDSGQNAFDRVRGTGPWYTFDGQVAVASHDELQSSNGITKEIGVDENGATGIAATVWTGASSSSQNCADWTTDYGSFCFGICTAAIVGNSGKKTSAWRAESNSTVCLGSARLYCFQQ